MSEARPQTDKLNPEIGNIIFGYSRGEFACDRDEYADIFAPLFEAIDPSDENWGYGCEWDSEVFEMHTYWWGDDEAPEAERPNFRHKRTGFEARWYK